MDKKRILIISASFYPLNSPRANRATELAREFSRQGHSVKVLTVFGEADYKKIEHDFNISISNLGKLKWELPDFGKSRFGYILTRAIFRFFTLLFEYPSIELLFKVKNALKKEKGYDLMISSAVPYTVHWGVAASREPNNKIATTWVADCGDPYMGCKTDSFKKPFYFKYIEKWFMKKTDFISIPVEEARSGYYNEFHPKIRIIPQGFKFDNTLLDVKKPNNQVPTFAYAGGFIPNIRDPREFLNLLVTIKDEFRFVVYTNSRGLLEPFQALLGNKLRIKDYIPRNELLEVLAQMDFLVNFDNNTGVQLPSKLIDYALTNRPVLNINNKFDSNLINQFLIGDYKNQMVLPDIKNYEISNIVAQFLQLTK